jgi:putative ABC transport system ATP-binding protein
MPLETAPDPTLLDAEGPATGEVIVTSNLWKTYDMGSEQVNAPAGHQPAHLPQ